MGIAGAMPYIAAVASIPAKGATMSGYRFRLFCLAGLLGVMLGASLRLRQLPGPTIHGPAWSRTSSTIVR